MSLLYFVRLYVMDVDLIWLDFEQFSRYSNSVYCLYYYVYIWISSAYQCKLGIKCYDDMDVYLAEKY